MANCLPVVADGCMYDVPDACADLPPGASCEARAGGGLGGASGRAIRATRHATGHGVRPASGCEEAREDAGACRMLPACNRQS